MAIYPCDHHGLRYVGPQQTIYPAVIVKGAQERMKRRLCPACFDETSSWIQQHMADATREDLPEGCCLCGSDLADAAVFCTVYAKGADRADFFAHACEQCAGLGVRVALFGAGTAA